MKKLFIYSYTTICALILFSACSGKGDPLISDVDKESYLSVDVSSLKYDGKGRIK